MDILPIRLITEDDKNLFGSNLVALGKLARAGFPVFSGIAVTAPDEVCCLAEKFTASPPASLHQWLPSLKKEILAIPFPGNLGQELAGWKNFFTCSEAVKSVPEVWGKLLESWFAEISAKFCRGVGHKEGTLKAGVIFRAVKGEVGEAYFDPHLKEVVIDFAEKLEPKVLWKIDQTVMKANRELVLPFIYSFLATPKQVGITGVKPFTHTPALAPSPILEVIPKGKPTTRTSPAVRIFLNLISGFGLVEGARGIFLEGERVPEFEERIFKLTEAALALPASPVIFKLPDVVENGVDGSLHLIHHQKLLSQAASAFLFVRHKKGLLNLELAVPCVRTAGEFLQIKRELAVLGISRKGTLKLWMEAAVPENVINLEDYLTVGLDGIILDLDKLREHLLGCTKIDGDVYSGEVKSLLEFIKPFFKTLHKAKIPVLVKGELVLRHQVLDEMLEYGIWGLIVSSLPQAESLPEQLHWAERRMVSKRQVSRSF